MSLALISGGLMRLYPQLSAGELSALAYMIYRGEALTAREIALNTPVYRTKVYGILNKLISCSLADEIVQKLEDVKKPDIWDWWTEARQSRWRTAQKLNTVKWIPKYETIRLKIDDAEIDFRFFRELRRNMRGKN